MSASGKKVPGMNERRAEVQRNMAQRQMAEVNMLIVQLRDAVTVAEKCRAGIAVVSAGTAARAARNLEDLQKRFLAGLAEG